MKYQRMTVASIIVLTGIIFLSSCDRDEYDEQISESVGLSVETSVAALTRVPKTYRFTGSVEGERRITLSTKVMGRITELPFETGDKVSRGETLLRVKNDNLIAQREQVNASLAEAEASLENTRTNYERIKALFADSSATQKELDDIATQFGMAEARVKALHSKLAEINDLIDYTNIESPIDGYIVQKMVSEGDLASPGQPLLTVEEVADLKVLASIPESQIDIFSTDDTLEVLIGATGEWFNGVVSSINPSADAGSRQFEVKMRIPRETVSNERVKPGMFADVILRKGEEPLMMVPESALVKRGQLTGLYALTEDNEVLLRWIRTGQKMNQQVEVLSGIQPGERYIVVAERKLKEGQKIDIQ